MKKLILIPMLLCAAAASGFAQSVIIPQTMSFQGYVTQSDTTFTDTTNGVTVTLALYQSADTSDHNQVWTQISTNVPVLKSYYSVMLNLAPNSGWTNNEYGFNKPLWLDAYVNNNHLIPRVQLTASAYSFQAQVADSARMADTANVALNLVAGAPVGTIVAYGGPLLSLSQETALGWYICDGSTVLSSDYPDYSSLCGLIYGTTGDSVYLPDMRGMFLRGVNETRDSTGDPEVASRKPAKGTGASTGVGSFQIDGLLDHTHTMTAGIVGQAKTVGTQGGYWFGTGGPYTDYAGQTGYEGGHPETRPRNVAVYWIIKVK